MFTGIIQAIGSIAALQRRDGDVRLVIDAGTLPMTDVNLGDSIAVSGVCLTVVGKTASGFSADVSGETLRRTMLGSLSVKAAVNLEKALTLETRLGGHLVSGHVDGIGTITARKEDSRSVQFTVQAPAQLARYIAVKGSICVDGVSLTVNAVDGAVFELNIVPHTLTATTLHEYRAGRQVNLEVDLVARYLERLLLGDAAAQSGAAGGITRALLESCGFPAK
ncbi:MAG: riboflavin synthase [Gammaproteobacteria bacterium]|jgi:riboflavin synthase|nr:riboflavin synthase [Gammaproteobacteria bacterium]